MRSRTVLAGAVVAASVLGTAGQAHHAVQASMDVNTTIEAKGILRKVEWINPHTWMRFDILNADGSVVKDVMVEALGIAAFRQIGIDSKAALKVGGEFTVLYYPNRSGTPGGYVSGLVLPDGRKFDLGNADPTAVAKTQ